MIDLPEADLPAAPAAAIVITLAPDRTPTPSLRLSPAQMFGLADWARRKADLAAEFAIYRALEANPESEVRAEARFRHAKRLIELDRGREAALLLRRLLDERPDALAARLELARTLHSLGDTDAALKEIRAAQAGRLPTEVARLIDRYSGALRAHSSRGASVEIALAPDSNVNRATRAETLGTVLGDFEIDEDSKARSGIGLALNGQLFRRFRWSDATNLLVRISGSADLYRRSQFNNLAVDVGVGPELAVGRSRIQVDVGQTQRWFGQKPVLRSTRIAMAYSRPLAQRTNVRLTASAATVHNRRNALQDGRNYTGSVQIEHALSPVMGLATRVSIARETLKDPGYSTLGWKAGLTGWYDVGQTTLTVGADAGPLRSDARLLLFPERRKDQYRRLTAGAAFRQIQLHGFAPLVRLSIERNQSNIAFYDFRRTRTELAIVRAF